MIGQLSTTTVRSRLGRRVVKLLATGCSYVVVDQLGFDQGMTRKMHGFTKVRMISYPFLGDLLLEMIKKGWFEALSKEFDCGQPLSINIDQGQPYSKMVNMMHVVYILNSMVHGWHSTIHVVYNRIVDITLLVHSWYFRGGWGWQYLITG